MPPGPGVAVRVRRTAPARGRSGTRTVRQRGRRAGQAARAAGAGPEGAVAADVHQQGPRAGGRAVGGGGEPQRRVGDADGAPAAGARHLQQAAVGRPAGERARRAGPPGGTSRRGAERGHRVDDHPHRLPRQRRGQRDGQRRPPRARAPGRRGRPRGRRPPGRALTSARPPPPGRAQRQAQHLRPGGDRDRGRHERHVAAHQHAAAGGQRRRRLPSLHGPAREPGRQVAVRRAGRQGERRRRQQPAGDGGGGDGERDRDGRDGGPPGVGSRR